MPLEQIAGLDYNAIRNKVERILGTTGTASQGYGQTLVSTPVVAGEIITKSKWDELAQDIINVKTHQDGIPPAIASIAPGSIISKGMSHPNTNFDNIIEQAILAKFNIGTGRSMVATKGTGSTTTPWTTSATCEVTVTFDTADKARYFFNSGGKIRFSSSRSGGTTTPQNNSWTNLLNSVGTQAFEAAGTNSVTFYTLTNIYQAFYQLGSSSSYAANNFKLEAKSNVTDNSLGTATTLYFRVSWNDVYVDPDTLNPDYPSNPVTIHAPGDGVDGTLTLTVEEFKATGPMVPSGTFTIESPTYSVSAISLDS